MTSPQGTTRAASGSPEAVAVSNMLMSVGSCKAEGTLAFWAAATRANKPASCRKVQAFHSHQVQPCIGHAMQQERQPQQCGAVSIGRHKGRKSSTQSGKHIHGSNGCSRQHQQQHADTGQQQCSSNTQPLSSGMEGIQWHEQYSICAHRQ